MPVARFLLQRGISFLEFEEIARASFVKVATEEYGLRGRPTNASRVAAMTGIPRRDVRRIRDSIEDYGLTPRTDISPLGDVLHRWHTDPAFLSTDGQPVKLTVDGHALSLAALVRRCVGDVPIGAIKVELLRTGAVTQEADGRLSPNRRHAVPVLPDDRLITSISFNLYGLVSTIAHNSDPKRSGPGRIERFVQSDPISQHDILTFRGEVRERVIAFTEGLDDTFSGVDADPNGAKKRIGVGVYYFEDE